MSATVHQIKAPETMALFYSQDTSPGFGVKLCAASGLVDAVHSTMFMGERTAEQIAECEGQAAQLRESGSIAFEDGWLELRTGLADIVAFVMSKAEEAKEGERFEDSRRYEEMKRAEAAEERYAGLREALRDALGERVAAVAAAAA